MKKLKLGKVQVAKDILAIIDSAPDGSLIIKYYDENQNFIAGRGADGELFPSKEFLNEDLGFLEELDASKESQGLSLEELENDFDEISKILGISKKDIRNMTEADLDRALIENEDSSIRLSDKSTDSLSDESQKEQNEIALENLTAKQEINLNRKIDNKHTLAEVLGVPEDSKLLVVASDKIQDNVNTTRFSCVIKSPNGEITNADMLKQVGGKDSDKNVYQTNRDGSRVEKQSVKSSFEIDSPFIPNGILTIKEGQMGELDVGYGQMARDSHNDAFTQKLETRQTYPVTSRVRNEFNQNRGIDNISDKIDEIHAHEEHNCHNLSLDEADGNFKTGHSHSDNAAELILSDDDVGNKIDEIYTFNEVKARFESMHEKHPDSDFDDLVEKTKAELAAEAEHMHSHELS